MLWYRVWEIEKGRIQKESIDFSKPICDTSKLSKFLKEKAWVFKDRHFLPAFHKTKKHSSFASKHLIKATKNKINNFISDKNIISKVETNSFFLKNILNHKEKLQKKRGEEVR